ncbi:MAG: metal ABC transporter permease [Coprobacter sp.]|nr:metal ABC transporter permease [Coprobacter sp.]
MEEIFHYSFFQHAVWAVLLISLAGAVIGTYVVTRRLVFITGGITHASFGGLGLGFFFGVNPVVTALGFAVLSALGVEWMSRRSRVREDSAIAVFWTLGMAVGIIFIFLTPGYTPGLNEFLFGSILTVTTSDLWIYASYTALLYLFFLLFYRRIVYVAFDRDFAVTRHVAVRFFEYGMTLFIAVCVVLSIRLVGIMLLLSLLTMPQLIADLFCNRYHHILLFSAAVGVVAGLSGLFISYGLNVPAGACIVFVLVVFYVLARLAVGLKKAFAAPEEGQ